MAWTDRGQTHVCVVYVQHLPENMFQQMAWTDRVQTHVCVVYVQHLPENMFQQMAWTDRGQTHVCVVYVQHLPENMLQQMAWTDPGTKSSPHNALHLPYHIECRASVGSGEDHELSISGHSTSLNQHTTSPCELRLLYHSVSSVNKVSQRLRSLKHIRFEPQAVGEAADIAIRSKKEGLPGGTSADMLGYPSRLEHIPNHPSGPHNKQILLQRCS
jgi:hypothetical protein